MSDAATVAGHCAPGFEPLRDLLAARLADGRDAGASLALVWDGEVLVDLWGGEARPGTPWERDTLVQVWSVTKTMAALTVLVLVDRGELDLDAPVARYWPEFAAAGKDGVLVRQLLSHTSGLPGWSETITLEDLLDLERANGLLAAQAPWFEPGSASGYEMISFGHLLDGLVRAATGRTLAEQFRTLLAEPLGADFHLGVPEADLDRCADLIPAPPGGIDPAALPEGNLLIPTLVNPLLDIGGACNRAPWRTTSVAGANGHGNARAVARLQSVVSHGGEVDGVRYLAPSTIEALLEPQSEGTDLVLLQPVRWGLGYSLPVPASAPAVPEGRVCWWTGYGGSIVVNDLDRRTTFAYTMNRLENHMMASPRTDAYVRTAWECLA